MNEPGEQRHSSRAEGQAKPAMQSALLCFDGSDNAKQAIRAAAALLGSRPAAVLCVWEPAASLTSFQPVGDLVGRATGIYREMDEVSAELADRHSSEGAAIARSAGFEAEALTARGEPWVEILRVAKHHSVAAIVLGAGKPSLHRSIAMGKVSARVVHDSSRPVLIIPALAALNSG